jgi:hypothetical protein
MLLGMGDLIASDVENSAEWRRRKADEFPEDAERNLAAAELLDQLARDLWTLEGGALHKRAVHLLESGGSDAVAYFVDSLSYATRAVGFRSFPDSGEQFFSELIDDLEKHSTAPTEFESDVLGESGDLKILHAQMVERIAALEEALQSVSKPGMGHNQPPEPLEPQEPLTAADLQCLNSAISTLKNQPVEPSKRPPEAVKAASVLQAVGAKVSEYLDVFVKEAIKAAGAEFGKWTIRLPMWKVVLASLAAASAAASAWIMALH